MSISIVSVQNYFVVFSIYRHIYRMYGFHGNPGVLLYCMHITCICWRRQSVSYKIRTKMNSLLGAGHLPGQIFNCVITDNFMIKESHLISHMNNLVVIQFKQCHFCHLYINTNCEIWTHIWMITTKVYWHKPSDIFNIWGRTAVSDDPLQVLCL